MDKDFNFYKKKGFLVKKKLINLNLIQEINKIISDYDINIKGQYLKTKENIGYVITDIDTLYNKEVVKSLKNISATIKLRVLY